MIPTACNGPNYCRLTVDSPLALRSGQAVLAGEIVGGVNGFDVAHRAR